MTCKRPAPTAFFEDEAGGVKGLAEGGLSVAWAAGGAVSKPEPRRERGSLQYGEQHLWLFLCWRHSRLRFTSPNVANSINIFIYAYSSQRPVAICLHVCPVRIDCVVKSEA